MMTYWNQRLALEVCREMSRETYKYGCHLALTGGCLYKDGDRKDLDILVYRIRQSAEIDLPGLFQDWDARLGIQAVQGGPWVYKLIWWGRQIDLFVPEEDKAIRPVDLAAYEGGERY